jgi:hypothetical protein
MQQIQDHEKIAVKMEDNFVPIMATISGITVVLHM